LQTIGRRRAKKTPQKSADKGGMHNSLLGFKFSACLECEFKCTQSMKLEILIFAILFLIGLDLHLTTKRFKMIITHGLQLLFRPLNIL